MKDVLDKLCVALRIARDHEAADALEKMLADNAAMEAQIAELRKALTNLLFNAIGGVSRVYSHADSLEQAEARKALATKAPDEYLKAWLGEPIAYGFEDGEIVCSQDMVCMGHKAGQRVTPFYAPKGMK